MFLGSYSEIKLSTGCLGTPYLHNWSLTMSFWIDFSSVDPKVAFNVEIKYGMLLKIGTEENPDPMEINLYLDKILEVVFSCAKKRPVMFSW